MTMAHDGIEWADRSNAAGDEEGGEWCSLGRALEAEDAEVAREARGILRALIGRVRERKAMRALGLPMMRDRATA